MTLSGPAGIDETGTSARPQLNTDFSLTAALPPDGDEVQQVVPSSSPSGGLGIVVSPLSVVRDGAEIVLQPGETLRLTDTFRPGTSGVVRLPDGSEASFGTDIDIAPLLSALASGAGWEQAVANVLGQSGQLALGFGAAGTALPLADAAFMQALVEAINQGADLAHALVTAQDAFWRQIELATTESAEDLFLNGLATGNLTGLLERILADHNVELGEQPSLEAVLELALQAGESPREALLEALLTSKTIADLVLAAANDPVVQLVNALASGLNTKALIERAAGGDDTFELALSHALSTGTSSNEAVAKATELAAKAAAANETAANNPVAQLINALASGDNVAKVMQAAASGDVAAFEQALSQALSTGTKANQALASASDSASKVTAANNAAASNPVAQLINALASGDNVAKLMEAAASGDSAAFEQALSQALSAGTTATQAVASAAETSGKTSAANTAAANSPQAQLVSALSSGKDVEHVVASASGGDGAAFEQGLSQALSTGTSADKAIASASDFATKTAEASSVAASNPQAQEVAGLSSGQNTGGPSGQVATTDPTLTSSTEPVQTPPTPAVTAQQPSPDAAPPAETSAAAAPAGTPPPSAGDTPPNQSNAGSQQNETEPAPTPPAPSQAQTTAPSQPQTSTPTYPTTAANTNYSSTTPYGSTQTTTNTNASPSSSSVSGSSSQTNNPPFTPAPNTSTPSQPTPPPQNQAPVNNFTVSMAGTEDTALVISGVSISDSDAGNGAMTTTLNVSHGVLVFTNNAGVAGNGTASASLSGTLAAINAALSGGNLSFHPDANFNGTAQLTISTNDNGNSGAGGALHDSDTITLQINSVNDAAVLSSASVSLTETNTAADLSASGTLTISDVDGAAAFVAQSGVAGTYGSFSINTAGAWTYTASSAHDEFAAGITYSDTFTVSAADGTQTTVIVNVVGTNDAPVLSAVQTNITHASEDIGYTLLIATLLENITDAEGDGIAIANLTVSDGAIGVTGSDYIYTPTADFSGAVTISYDVVDGKGDVLHLTRALTIDPVTDTPSLTVASASGPEDSAGIALSVSAAVTDLVGTSEVISGIVITGVVNGALSAGIDQGGGSWLLTQAQLSGLTFIPQADFNGTVTLSVTATAQDGSAVPADSVAKTLEVTVTPVADAPLGSDATIAINEDTTHTLSATDFGFSDPADRPADAFSGVLITTLPGAGALTINNVAVTAGQEISIADIDAGKLVYTPAQDANGAGYANFTFQVQDDGSLVDPADTDIDATPNTISFDVTAVNDAAIIQSDTTSIALGDAGFESPDISAAPHHSYGSGKYGGWIIDAWTYTGLAGITHNDSTGLSANNDAPEGDQAGFIQFEGENGSISQQFTATAGHYTLAFDFAQVHTEANRNATFVAEVAGVSHTVAVNGDTSFKTTSFDFDIAADGTYEVKFTSVETNPGQSSATLLDKIAITGVATYAVTEDVQLTASGDLNHTDSDNTDDIWQAVSTPAASAHGYGTFVMTAAGEWTYTLDNANATVQALNAGETATDSFDVFTEDGTQTTVSVIINGTDSLEFAGEMVAHTDAPDLAAAELEPIVTAAIARWADAGLSEDKLEILAATSVAIDDLAGGKLGLTLDSSVIIDVNAAGQSWFIDATPADDAEFTGDNAPGGVDLLSVVMHEFGHVLGLEHTDGSASSGALMAGELEAGERFLPDPVGESLLPDDADQPAADYFGTLHTAGLEVA